MNSYRFLACSPRGDHTTLQMGASQIICCRYIVVTAVVTNNNPTLLARGYSSISLDPDRNSCAWSAS
eukprot:12786435-Heterocapsa_arctica.AAC.1